MPDSAGGLREAQVGGGEAQRTAELAPAHHSPADRVGAAEQVVGAGEIALLQQLADAGAGDALAVQVHRFDLARGEAEFGAHLLQQCQITAAAVAEAELRPDPDFAGAQPVHQQPAHEGLGRHRRHRRVETQQADRIDAELAQDLDLAARQGQPRRRRALGEEFTRQRLECHGHCGHAQARARATAWRTSARWPRWRPSNAPIQTTLPLGNSSPPSTLLNSLLINSRSGPTGPPLQWCNPEV